MIDVLLFALGSVTAGALPGAVDPSVVANARQAIAAGRLKEARLLITRAVAAGAHGPTIERLLAALAFQNDNFDEAASRYEHLLASGQKDAEICEGGAVAELRLSHAEKAKAFVDCAVTSPHSSWRAWNARGVLADLEQDWGTADQSYAHAHELAPNEAEVVNNQGWSRLMRGDWAGALPLLRDAAKLDPSSPRIRNNLELAESAVATDLPKRRSGESDRDWAIRLNDAGVAAELRGDHKKAIAAFTRALHASDVWYARAANNLEAMSVN